MSRKRILLICFLILLVGGGLTTLIFSTEPTASRSGASRETAMLVDVVEVQRGTFRPTIKAMGTVQPSQDIVLSPRVNGEIMKLSDAFTPGGYVQKGEMLLQIDSADYRNNLLQRRSELSQAMADMNIEMGQQEFAKREFQDYQSINDTLSAENRALILREPQLSAVRSQVESARAAVEQAKLDLQRTTVRAPFDAHILSRTVNVGSQVAAGDALGRLVGLDTYWVEATIPLSKLLWLTFSEDSQNEGSNVEIRNRTAWAENEFRNGSLHRVVGALEEQTRMARVLITVSDPLSYRSDDSELPSLMIGSFVEASIRAKEVTDVVRLNRDYIRSNETVWVMEEDSLRIRDVDIILQDATYAYISSGLNDKELVVTTNLSTVTDGVSLRLEGSEQDTLSRTIEQ